MIDEARTREAGFTLVEILIAVGLTALVMLSVHMSFSGTIQAGVEMEALSEEREPGPRILAALERDLQGLWHFNIKKNRVLRGRNLDIAGAPADRIDMLTTTDATSYVIDQLGRPVRASVCEVGYWLRQNPDNPQLMELWRREDPLVDDDILREGQFQLVHDRIKSFNITYFPTLGFQAEPQHEWDSSVEDTLPRRVLVEFTLERKLSNRNRATGVEVGDEGPVERSYARHIVLDSRYPEILKPGVAMVPVRPRRPEAEGNGPLGPAGGPGSSGPVGGPAGPGGIPGARGGEGRGGQRGGNVVRDGGRGGGDFPFPGGGNRGGGNINLGDLLRGGGNGLFGNRGGGGNNGGGGRR